MKVAIEIKERSNKALLKAIRLKGSENSLAKEIGESRQVINHWKMSNAIIPFEKAMKVHLATKGRASIYELRADVGPLTKEFIGSFCEP